jgi:gliding motility-associated lipoprotein GldH
VALAGITACRKINVYEKHATIPSFAWNKNFIPKLHFENQSEQSRYQVFFVMRHTDAYPYNNIWIRLHFTPPGDSTQTEDFNIPLTRGNEKWAGVGMDDIFELRKELRFKKIRPVKNISACTFALEQIMRDNPLPHVMNVGLRIEKIR